MKVDELSETLEEPKLTKKEALTKIEEKVALMKQALREAQALADAHGLKFKVALDYENNKSRDFGQPVQGTYIGRHSESDTWQGKTTQYPEQGYFYWENSSLNC
jgi:hypothetical protein